MSSNRCAILLGTLLIACGNLSANAETILFGPTPYLSAADSPFNLADPSFSLEDFEDGLLNTPGVTADNGSVRGPSGLTDSVDADDGSIDGDGSQGHSFLVRPGSVGVSFQFDAAILGGFPTFVGIVSTDGFIGVPANTVEFYDSANVLIATLNDPVQNATVNTTDDDRFLGVFHSSGISRIRISNLGTGSTGMEADHLQYGVPVPEPTGMALLVIGACCLTAYGLAGLNSRRGTKCIV